VTLTQQLLIAIAQNMRRIHNIEQREIEKQKQTKKGIHHHLDSKHIEFMIPHSQHITYSRNCLTPSIKNKTRILLKESFIYY